MNRYKQARISKSIPYLTTACVQRFPLLIVPKEYEIQRMVDQRKWCITPEQLLCKADDISRAYIDSFLALVNIPVLTTVSANWFHCSRGIVARPTKWCDKFLNTINREAAHKKPGWVGPLSRKGSYKDSRVPLYYVLTHSFIYLSIHTTSIPSAAEIHQFSDRTTIPVITPNSLC